jgi:hypothetical protein
MMNDTSLGFLSYQDEKYTYSSSSSDHFESQQFLLEICIMKGEERRGLCSTTYSSKSAGVGDTKCR